MNNNFIIKFNKNIIIMIFNLVKIWSVFLIFIKQFESSVHTLQLLPQPHSIQNRDHAVAHRLFNGGTKEYITTLSTLSTPSSNLSNWNWKTTPTLETKPELIAHQSSNWTWNSDLNSEAVEGKTMNLQVFEDLSKGDIGQPQWSHDEFTYDPYTFQHHKRQNKNINDQLHLQNQLYEFPPRPQEYVWKDLQPLMYKHKPMHHYAPKHHHSGHAYSRLPVQAALNGHFGSGVSANSPNVNVAVTTAEHGIISHGSSHAVSTGYGGQQPTGGDTSRKYGYHDHSWKHYHHYPPLDYKRKRYRLEIHPGFIAAPIAGLAAFGVAHAFNSKPVLLELGLVDKKRGHGHHQHNPLHLLPVPEHQPMISNPEPQPYPYPHPHFKPQPQPFPLPHPHLKPQPHPHPHLKPQSHPHPEYSESLPSELATTDFIGNSNYPMLRPIDKPSHASETESKPWWNPFAAMIPRITR